MPSSNTDDNKKAARAFLVAFRLHVRHNEIGGIYMKIKILLFFFLLIHSVSFAETLSTNSWWRVEEDGMQYSLSDYSMAQVVLDNGLPTVRTVRPGHLTIYCYFPDGHIQEVEVDVTGDPIDGSAITPNYQQECLDMVNWYRAQGGLPLLVLDYTLCREAEIRARELQTKYAHVRTDGSECFSVLSGDYRVAGENIAKNVKTTKAVVEGWYHSPSHRENIMNPEFARMGVGVSVNLFTRDAMFWAQLFEG